MAGTRTADATGRMLLRLALLAIPGALGYATCGADFPTFNATTASDMTSLQLRLSQNVDGDVCLQLLADLVIDRSVSIMEGGRPRFSLSSVPEFGAPARVAICASGHTISIRGTTVSTSNDFFLRDAVVNMTTRGAADDFYFIHGSGTYTSQDNTYNAPEGLLNQAGARRDQYKKSSNVYLTPGAPASLSNDVFHGGGTHVRVRSNLASPLSTSNCTFHAREKAVVINCASPSPSCPDNLRGVADHVDPTSRITYCTAGATRLPNTECQPCIKPLLCGAPPDASALIPFPGDQCVYERHVGSNCVACEPGWFRSPTGACAECPDAPLQLILGLPVYLLMLLITFAISKTPSSDALGLFTISTLNLQLVGVLFSLEGMHFPQILIDINVNLELAFNLKFLSWLSSPECFDAGAPFNQSWLLSILPVFIGQLFFAVLACVFRSNARKTQAMRAFWQFANFTMLFLFHQTLMFKDIPLTWRAQGMGEREDDKSEYVYVIDPQPLVPDAEASEGIADIVVWLQRYMFYFLAYMILSAAASEPRYAVRGKGSGTIVEGVPPSYIKRSKEKTFGLETLKVGDQAEYDPTGGRGLRPSGKLIPVEVTAVVARKPFMLERAILCGFYLASLLWIPDLVRCALKGKPKGTAVPVPFRAEQPEPNSEEGFGTAGVKSVMSRYNRRVALEWCVAPIRTAAAKKGWVAWAPLFELLSFWKRFLLVSMLADSKKFAFRIHGTSNDPDNVEHQDEVTATYAMYCGIYLALSVSVLPFRRMRDNLMDVGTQTIYLLEVVCALSAAPGGLQVALLFLNLAISLGGILLSSVQMVRESSVHMVASEPGGVAI